MNEKPSILHTLIQLNINNFSITFSLICLFLFLILYFGVAPTGYFSRPSVSEIQIAQYVPFNSHPFITLSRSGRIFINDCLIKQKMEKKKNDEKI